MPELPDVEIFRRRIARTALRKRIDRVRVDPSVLGQVSQRALSRRLRGRELRTTRRHGKWLLADIDEDGWLVLHYGMTGFPAHFRDEADAPDHPRLLITFEGGDHLAHDDRRKLGMIDVVESPERLATDHDLGPDALDLDVDDLDELLAERRGSIKAALMNQSLIAGIGNIYSDEILFQARHHPKTDVRALDRRERRGLHRVMRRVLDTAIERRADPGRVPSSWLLPRREEGASCPRCRGHVERITVGGRGCYLCPDCQRRREG